MGYDKRANAKQYALKDGDTLGKIAERETAAGNKLAGQDIAKFNWGTANPDEINRFLRDELGCYKRDDANNFVISADAKAKGKLLIPVPFKADGLATAKTHTLKAKKQPPPPQQFRGCARVKGVHFDFDSSFIRPSVVDDLKRLEEELKKHPDGKVMIFGHTDKVGTEEYNKGLSERRAKSVFAFITDDADIWEGLYNDPHEKWGLKVVQTILKDLGHDPGPIDGVMGSKTRAAIQAFDPASSDNTPAMRKKLFKAYMTGKHDVKLTPDRFMDPKHMGCGEFNPIVQTEQPSEANRRVTFYIFNKDRLPTLPCKTGDLAPCRQQTSQPVPRHKESFRCSFYDSIAKDCPCEHGPIPPPPPPPVPATIEILDAASNVATSVKIGLWDNAFDAAGNVLNDVVEANNFAGADTRRFHFRVTDPAATDSFVNIDWKTLGSTRADLDTASVTPNLTLVETSPGTKIFVSRGLLLTCDLDDVKEKTNSGLTAPLPDPGDRNHGQTNHRTRTAAMEGFVKGEYTPASGAAVSVELPVFERSPDERRRLPIQFFVLRVAAGGAGVVATAPGSPLWTTDIRVIKETYERLGIKFETLVPPATPPTDVVTVDGISIILINAPAGVNPLNVTTANETTIGTAFPLVGHTVRVFVTGGLASGNRGEAAPDVDFAGTPDQGTAFIDGPTRGPYTIAHETGHMLINKSSAVSGGHYTVPAAPAGNRLFNNQNLMRNGTSLGEGVNQSKRLWDAADGDANNGFTSSRGSPYTRPF